ncbi:MAG: uroporphyrinogen-III C-methyltransferase [Candidatus Promineifilaceae bacterium]
MNGKAYLVGAGPGSPDLITVKGLRLIRSADVLLYDRLIPQELLNEARADAELIFVGKRAGHHAMLQPDTTRVLLEKVQAGQQVVRLKGGDPFVFGRGGEEAIALAEAGLAFEVVPGISSSIAAPSYAGVPLTQKGVSAAFGIVAGHETPDKPNSTTDWAAMAKLPTLVVLMGMKRLPFVVKALLDEGRSAETPATIISHGTTDQQQSITGTLGNLPALALEHKLPTPAVTVIGDVARFHDAFAWFKGNSHSAGFVDLAAKSHIHEVSKE